MLRSRSRAPLSSHRTWMRRWPGSAGSRATPPASLTRPSRPAVRLDHPDARPLERTPRVADRYRRPRGGAEFWRTIVRWENPKYLELMKRQAGGWPKIRETAATLTTVIARNQTRLTSVRAHRRRRRSGSRACAASRREQQALPEDE
jgi:hypothetical protein